MSKYKPMVTEYTNSLIYDIEVWLENTNRSRQIFDTLDICHLIGKIQYQQKKIELLQNDLDNANSKLKDYVGRCLKAIEYIEQHNDYFLLKREVKELLYILKGDNKE